MPRAVVHHARGTKAPHDVVVHLRAILRHIAFLTQAGAPAAGILAAAISIGDQVGLAVIRVDAGADPGGGRWRTARRTSTRTTAAAGAQIAVARAIAPVIALRRIGGLSAVREIRRIFGGSLLCRLRSPRHGQQRQRGSRHQPGAAAREKASPRNPLRDAATRPLDEAVESSFGDRLHDCPFAAR